MDQSASDSKDAVEDGTSTADYFTAISNWGKVNKEGTMDNMAWDVMVQEEVQY